MSTSTNFTFILSQSLYFFQEILSSNCIKSSLNSKFLFSQSSIIHSEVSSNITKIHFGISPEMLATNSSQILFL
jgi:hypothetical protein